MDALLRFFEGLEDLRSDFEVDFGVGVGLDVDGEVGWRDAVGVGWGAGVVKAELGVDLGLGVGVDGEEGTGRDLPGVEVASGRPEIVVISSPISACP